MEIIERAVGIFAAMSSFCMFVVTIFYVADTVDKITKRK